MGRHGIPNNPFLKYSTRSDEFPALSFSVFLVLQTFVLKPQKVKEVLKRAIKEKMEGQAYDPVKGSQVRMSYGHHH